MKKIESVLLPEVVEKAALMYHSHNDEDCKLVLYSIL